MFCSQPLVLFTHAHCFGASRPVLEMPASLEHNESRWNSPCGAQSARNASEKCSSSVAPEIMADDSKKHKTNHHMSSLL